MNDLEHVEISTLSAEQRELLQIYLDRADIPHDLSADRVTVPEHRASDLYAALAIVVRARPADVDGTAGDRAGRATEVSPSERPPLIKPPRIVADGRIAASRSRRLVGAVLDWLTLDLWAFAAHAAGAPSWATVTTLGLYVIIATALFGRTLGKVAVGTVVVAHRTGAPAGWLRSTVRWLTTSWFGVVTLLLHGLPGWVDVAAFAVLLATYAPVLWDRESRGWHDRAADTVVVLAKQRRRT